MNMKDASGGFNIQNEDSNRLRKEDLVAIHISQSDESDGSNQWAFLFESQLKS